MRKLPALAAALFASLVLVAAGCGGDDGPSKDEFIAQADRICDDGNKSIQTKVEQEFGNAEPSKKEITEFVSSTYVPEFQKQVDDLRALEPPADDQGT